MQTKLFLAGAVCGLSMLLGCGGGPGSGFTPDGSNGGSDAATQDEDPEIVFPDASVEAAPPCTGIKCQQVTCSSGKTTVSGTVYAPNGTLPLYNVIVYIPNAPLDPIPSGATCDACGAQVSGSPIVTALTDAKGNFVLENVPVGSDIPLVMQIGKWRRQITIPTVAQCVDTKLTNAQQTRLPKNRNEGNIPKIAVTTGGCDPLACLLPKIGIEANEYGVSAASPARVTMYAGSGGSGPSGITPATNLWNNAAEMKKFDLAIFSCECSEYNNTKTNPGAVLDYVNSGGKIFGSHYHYTWFENLIPQWQGTASWGFGSGSTPAAVDTSFPKGKAMADWLTNQGLQPNNLPLTETSQDVANVIAPTTRWLYASGGTTTHYLSFNAPVGKKPDQQCGKAVYGGMHISSGGGSVSTTFPAGCSASLSAQEKVLAFLFFDLSSCVQDDTKPPVPPVPN
ncbi:hypothetical protein BH09MYX1_BH09MYX1_21670 [soil metagenome]